MIFDTAKVLSALNRFLFSLDKLRNGLVSLQPIKTEEDNKNNNNHMVKLNTILVDEGK